MFNKVHTGSSEGSYSYSGAWTAVPRYCQANSGVLVIPSWPDPVCTPSFDTNRFTKIKYTNYTPLNYTENDAQVCFSCSGKGLVKEVASVAVGFPVLPDWWRRLPPQWDCHLWKIVAPLSEWQKNQRQGGQGLSTNYRRWNPSWLVSKDAGVVDHPGWLASLVKEMIRCCCQFLSLGPNQ